MTGVDTVVAGLETLRVPDRQSLEDERRWLAVRRRTALLACDHALEFPAADAVARELLYALGLVDAELRRPTEPEREPEREPREPEAPTAPAADAPEPAPSTRRRSPARRARPAPPTVGPGDRLLTTTEVAALFDVHPRTVVVWANRGRFHPIRTLGGHRRYREREIHALLSQSLEARHGQ